MHIWMPFLPSLWSLLSCTQLWNALKLLYKRPAKALVKIKKVLKECEDYSNNAGLIMSSIWTGWLLAIIKQIILFRCFHLNLPDILHARLEGGWGECHQLYLQLLQISGGQRDKFALCEYKLFLNSFTFHPQWGLHNDITKLSFPEGNCSLLHLPLTLGRSGKTFR